MYYFNRKTGLSLSISTNEDATPINYGLGLEHFFNERIFASLLVARTDIDAPDNLLPSIQIEDPSFTTYGASLGLRF